MYKPTFTKKLPPNPDIVDRDGKAHVRIREGGRAVLYPVTACGTMYLKELDTWYAKVRQPNGKRKPVPLSPNKRAAEIMLGEMLQAIEMGKAGAVDPFREHAVTPLADHLAAWQKAQHADGVTRKHYRAAASRVQKVCDHCRFTFAPDFDPADVTDFLADLREADSRPVPPDKTEYTKKELAEFLGVSLAAIPPMIRRHNLTVTGELHGRRFPRETVVALAERKARGASARTANTYLIALKAFVNWMVQGKRIAANPFDHLSAANENTDRRHDRRTLTEEETFRLIDATQNSSQTVRGLTGRERAVLYHTALGTGFRASELASLAIASFSLATNPPTIHLAADKAKNRQEAVQPISPSLADVLRPFLAGKPPRSLAWPGKWAADAVDVLRHDLDTAGIPYRVDSPTGTPLFADFHCLRHTFIRRLDESGATLKEAMQLARHSDPKLTMAIYGRASVAELGDVVSRLTLVPSHVPKHVPAGDSPCGTMRTDEETCPVDTPEQALLQVLNLKTFEDECGEMMTAEEVHPTGVEPVTFGSGVRVSKTISL
ncbi:tyrosine-type recombinase/integrase [Limnoglobus roseus]|nr:tyrosine-type recombinase/integrase [Limnoglobus roseus]